MTPYCQSLEQFDDIGSNALSLNLMIFNLQC